MFAATLFGCDTSDSCNLRSVVGRYTDASLHDCGDLPLWSTPGTEPTWRIANACVAQNLENRTPFVVQWDQPTIDSNASAAYLGMHVDGQWTLMFFEASAVGPDLSRQSTIRSSCASLVPTAGCDTSQLFESLCFHCEGPARLDDCLVE